jgi:hypothetical protein
MPAVFESEKETTMTTKTLVLGIAILGMTALSGCEMYYGDRDGDGRPSDGYTYCDERVHDQLRLRRRLLLRLRRVRRKRFLYLRQRLSGRIRL